MKLSRLFFSLLLLGLLVAVDSVSFADTAKKTTTKRGEKVNAPFAQSNPPKSGDTIAVIKTNQGTMKAIIFTQQVPNAASNFVELAQQGKYNNVGFHRVIEGFMIQGGDFTRGDGTGGHAAKGPGSTIGDQYHPDLKHARGALAWAKTSLPNSIGSQFYIVHGANGAAFLDHPVNGGPAEGYSVFGQVYEGFDVLDKIATTETDPRDKPLTAMTIESVVIESAK